MIAADAGCREVVVTGGAAGCWWVDDDGNVHHEPSRALAVVDPVGAGDAFTGGYLATRLHGGTQREAAAVASILAAAVVGTAGDTAGLTGSRSWPRTHGPTRSGPRASED